MLSGLQHGCDRIRDRRGLDREGLIVFAVGKDEAHRSHGVAQSREAVGLSLNADERLVAAQIQRRLAVRLIGLSIEKGHVLCLDEVGVVLPVVQEQRLDPDICRLGAQCLEKEVVAADHSLSVSCAGNRAGVVQQQRNELNFLRFRLCRLQLVSEQRDKVSVHRIRRTHGPIPPVRVVWLPVLSMSKGKVL